MKKRLQFLMGLVGSGLVLCIVCLVLEKRNADIRLILTVIFAINLSVWIGLLLKVSQPFQRFTEKATPFCRGEQSTIPTSEKYPEEFQRLANSVNRVAERRGLLSLSMEQSKYLGLQNQINPHFLYNTLDTIRGYASIENAPTTGSMIEILSHLFRYTVSSKQDRVTISQEIGIAREYIKIQEYRINVKIQMAEVIDDDIHTDEYYIPKMILQPIIENAIQHGMPEDVAEFIVRLYIYRTQSRIIISIKDNGVGMTTDTVAKLNQGFMASPLSDIDMAGHSKKGGTGVGLQNINRRIKLMFGEEYGIYCYSSYGEGSSFDISLPAGK